MVIVDRNKDTYEAFEAEFRSLPEVETALGAFETIDCFDAIATAGNSFGLMDAGIDLAIVRFFGRPLMEAIQRRILEDYLGEQPVGTAFVMETGHSKHPYVVHTPTMRAPMNISGTDNVYVATFATLLAVYHHNQTAERTIETLLIPGFGTGSGGVDYEEAALQMRLACEHFLRPPSVITPALAQRRYEAVHYGGRGGFERPRG